jgi:hypothetical protein
MIQNLCTMVARPTCKRYVKVSLSLLKSLSGASQTEPCPKDGR